MKRIIRCGYDPNKLDELVERYSDCSTSEEEVWEQVYNETGDENLANDVVDAIHCSDIRGAVSLTRNAQSCQRDCRDAYDKFHGNIPIWKLQDIYQTYTDVDKQLINMWCKGR